MRYQLGLWSSVVGPVSLVCWVLAQPLNSRRPNTNKATRLLPKSLFFMSLSFLFRFRRKSLPLHVLHKRNISTAGHGCQEQWVFATALPTQIGVAIFRGSATLDT